MDGVAIIALLIHSAALVVLGWAVLYKEPQYTLMSWLALGAFISNLVGLGQILINT